MATGASARGDDLVAVQQWRELAKLLKPDDPEERLWYLLANRRVEQLEAAIRDRRKYIEKQLQIADEAFRTGHPNQAISIRSKLVEQYANYTDLADLFPPTPVPDRPAPATPAPAQPAPRLLLRPNRRQPPNLRTRSHPPTPIRRRHPRLPRRPSFSGKWRPILGCRGSLNPEKTLE